MSWRRVIFRLLWIIPYVLVLWIGLFMLDEHTKAAQRYASLSRDEGILVEADAAHEGGSNLPAFFFTLDPAGWHPSFHESNDATTYRHLSRYTNSPEDTEALYAALMMGLGGVEDPMMRDVLTRWVRTGAADDYRGVLDIAPSLPADMYAAIHQRVMESDARRWWPRLHFHGGDNRFLAFGSQLWLGGQVRSRLDGRLVGDKLLQAAMITLVYQGLSLLLVFIVGMWLGRWLYAEPDGTKTRTTEHLLYVLHALPLFWIASLVLMLVYLLGGGGSLLLQRVSGADHVSVIDLLHPSNWDLLLWPILTMVIGSLAMVAMQMRSALAVTDQTPYVLSARVRGLGKRDLLRTHQLPHARYTMVTLLANSIPGLLVGSVVVELIFNIPGMGRLLWSSLYGYDWPVVYEVVLWMMVFSLLSQLYADTRYEKDTRYG